jgi:hypothetical protein
MELPSEEEILRTFEKLNLKSEEDRLKMLFQGQKSWTTAHDSVEEKYYTTRLSANSRIEVSGGLM